LILLLKARNLPVKAGEFGKTMLVNAECSGPVNLIIET